jgi:hypothetical protein
MHTTFRVYPQGRHAVYLSNCGPSARFPVHDLRLALLVAFGGDDEASAAARQHIERLETNEQLAKFCASQPRESLIFVFDQFNEVQPLHFISSYQGSKDEIARDYFRQVWSHDSRSRLQ